jgi:glycerophosphoryl diester phosphodiesterase
MNRPLVIAHRGACGYRPENTIESFELGIVQGADGLEFDLVTTKDKQLIIRHENALSGTTDIASRPEFAGLFRSGIVEGKDIDDWYSEDLSLDQIKQLRAVERLAELRPGSAKFDSQFVIPSFSELLEQDFIAQKILVCEIKSGSHLENLQDSIGPLVAQVISGSSARNREVQFIIESFNFEILKQTEHAMQNNGLSARYFYALDDIRLASVDIQSLSAQIDGLAISLGMLRAEPTWVERAHKFGLEIWVYTARAEEADTSIEAYYEEIIQSGVDGIFADQPDLLRRVLQDSRGSAYDY